MRIPVWAPRPDVPIEVASAWPVAPIHGSPFRIVTMTGVLRIADLLVLGHVCTRYLEYGPADRRVWASLSDVARWTGARTVGGSQRRASLEGLSRLRGATFASRLRFSTKGSERHVGGWGFIDEFWMPEGGSRPGSISVSNVMAELMDAGVSCCSTKRPCRRSRAAQPLRPAYGCSWRRRRSMSRVSVAAASRIPSSPALPASLRYHERARLSRTCAGSRTRADDARWPCFGERAR